MTGNIYLDLTNEFNAEKLRAILSGNQAAVMHKVSAPAIWGDWILREDSETFASVLRVLESHGAHYRLGAPLDARWMRGGWSAHFEFNHDRNRIRCDFVSRLPRITSDDLEAMWREMENGEGIRNPVPTVDARRLAELKKTDRERDYAFIGEIARLLPEASKQVLLNRSARDLIELWPQISPQQQQHLAAQRPLLREMSRGRDAIEVALDAERRALSRINERRLAAFGRAASLWTAAWTQTSREIDGLSLLQGHRILVERAVELLPEVPDE